MQKTTTTTVAAVGDFVQYQLTVENTSTNAAVASVRIVDQLPLGARYHAGSTRSGAAIAPDPEISADGRTLTFTSGALGPGQRLEIRYVVEITAGARGKQLVNAARAIGPDGAGVQLGAVDDSAARRAVPQSRDRHGPRRRGRVRESDAAAARCRGRARLSRRRPLLGHRRRRQVSLRRRRAGLARRADGYRHDSRYASAGGLRQVTCATPAAPIRSSSTFAAARCGAAISCWRANWCRRAASLCSSKPRSLVRRICCTPRS